MSGRGLRSRVGNRKVDRDVDGRQRRRDHEDDQKHEDDIDEGRDVDLMRSRARSPSCFLSEMAIGSLRRMRRARARSARAGAGGEA